MTATTSLLGAVSSALHTMHKAVQARGRALAESGGFEETFEAGGLSVRYAYTYAHWNGSDTRFSITIDGVEFALERETYKWSLAGGFSVRYWVWLDLAKPHALQCLKAAGLPAKCLMEELYPTTNGPARFNACVGEFDDVLRLWRVWDPTYRVKDHATPADVLRGRPAESVPQ